MGKIEKKNGFVYLVQGAKGFETYFRLGKDLDSPMWKEEVKEFIKEEIDEITPPKVKKTKKSED